MGYTFWFFRWWGAADAKGIMIFSLFFPTVIIVPTVIWVLLGACMLLITQKIAKREEMKTPAPFFPTLCMSAILTTLLVIL